MRTYNKLVRDRIPQIIKRNRQAAVIKKLNKTEFSRELFKKLKEEIQEVIEAKNNKKELTKEIGDVYEVIDAVIDLHKLNKNSILELQKERNKKRGGFKEKIFLVSVEE